MSDPDTTHGAVIRDFQQERAKLIDQLSKARALLAGASGYMRAIGLHTEFEDGLRRAREIDAFLDAGLFGDRSNG